MTVVKLSVPRRAWRALLTVAFAVYVAALLAWCAVEVGTLFRDDAPTIEDRRTSSLFEAPPAPPVPVPLEATAYCACPICCGSWADGRTATGTWATEGRTVAADPRLFAAGTCLALGDIGRRIVEDTGSAILGWRVDVYFDTHQAALDFGRRFVSWGRC